MADLILYQDKLPLNIPLLSCCHCKTLNPSKIKVLNLVVEQMNEQKNVFNGCQIYTVSMEILNGLALTNFD